MAERTLKEVLADPNFAGLSPEAKSHVFDKYATTDQDYVSLSEDAKQVVRSKYLGGEDVASRAALNLEGLKRHEQEHGGIVDQFTDRAGARLKKAGREIAGAVTDPGIVKTPLGLVGGVLGGFSAPFAGAAGAAGEAVAGGEGVTAEVAEEVGDLVAPMPPVLKILKKLKNARRIAKVERSAMEGLAKEEAQAAAKALPKAVGMGDQLPTEAIPQATAGIPQKVFHGTGSPFSGPFDPSAASQTGNPTSVLGHFFTANEKEAARYASDFSKSGRPGAVIPARLGITNPHRMPYKEFDDLAMAAFRDPRGWDAAFPDAVAAAKKVRDDLVKEGYDGIVIGRGGQTEYVAFNPKQITRLDEAADSLPTAGGPPLPPDALPKYAGNINLNRINSDVDTKIAILRASKRIPMPERVPVEEIEEAARKMGFDLEDAEKASKKLSKKNFAAQFLATRDVHTAMQEAYVAARNAYREAGTPENWERLRVAQANALRGFAAAQDMASKAGLALRSFAIDSTANVGSRAKKAIDAMLLEVEKRGKLSDDITKKLADIDLENPEQVTQFLRFLSTKKASWSDKFHEAYLASLLSGPKTHVVNGVSNVASSVLEASSAIAAAGVDAVTAKLTGRARERFAREAFADLAGMIGGVRDGARAAVKSWKTEVASDAANKFDMRGPAIEGIKGKIARAPLRALTASDEFFKAINRRGALHASAWRDALSRGFSGDAAKAEVARLLDNPTDEMTEWAEEQAKRRTFQDDPGQALGAIYGAREAIPGARWVIPFVKTPYNIAKRGLEYSPFGLVGAMKKTGGAKSDAIGRAMVGSTIMGAVATHVMQGNITGGGPSDPEQRKLMEANGWKPYSIKFGDTYYPYSRLEPFATILGIAADGTEIWDKAEEGDRDGLAKAVSLSIAKNLTSKTFMEGLSNALDALDDPERYGEKFVAGFAQAAVPSLVAGVARGMDPQMREARTIIDRVKARIPVVRETLPPLRDMRGQPIPAPGGEGVGGFLTRAMSPVEPSQERGGVAERVMVELGTEVPGLPRRLSLKGRSIDLTPEEYDRFQVLAGENVNKMLALVEQKYGQLGRLPREVQQRVVKEAVQRARDGAANRMKVELLKADKSRFAEGKVPGRISGARSIPLPPTPTPPQP